MKRFAVATLAVSFGLFGLALPAGAEKTKPVQPERPKPCQPAPPKPAPVKAKAGAAATTKPVRPVEPKPTKPVQPKPPPPVKAKPNPGQPVQATLKIDYPAGTGTVTVTGAFSGDGMVETLRSKQAGCTRHFVEKLTFGSDSVTIRALAVRVARQLEPSTCTLTEKHKGVWKITTGTGAFANVKGAGHLVATATVTGTPDSSKPNGCDLSNPTGTIVVDAKGRVKQGPVKG